MTTKAARDIVKYKIEQGYSGKANALLKLDAHPLYTSVMLCIEGRYLICYGLAFMLYTGVAAIVRGDTKDNLCGFENSINVCSSTPGQITIQLIIHCNISLQKPINMYALASIYTWLTNQMSWKLWHWCTLEFVELYS